MEAYKRSQRVASRMREELTLLLRGMNDPRLVAPVITRVELTDDLSFARIFVRQELLVPDEAAQKRMLRDMRSPGDMQTEWWAQRFQRIEAIRKFFAETGETRTLAQIALAWIWTRSERAIPIPGFKTVAQARENIRAMEFGLLNNEQMKKIDEIFGRVPVIT